MDEPAAREIAPGRALCRPGFCYGDSFERNVGKDTPLKLEPGQNALWTKGGLMYAIPFR